MYAIIVLMLYSWTILWFFWRLPGWRIYMTLGEIAGVAAFSLATVFLESLLVLCVLLLLALCLPRAWFREPFVARGGSLAAALLAYMMFLDDRFKFESLYPALPTSIWVLALPAIAVLLLPYAAGRVGWLRKATESIADRATVFLYLWVPVSVICVVVVAVRFLIQTQGL